MKHIKMNELDIALKEKQKLQSNWNSLREWLEEKDNNGFEKFYIEDALYKMNELEGVDNENNGIKH